MAAKAATRRPQGRRSTLVPPPVGLGDPCPGIALCPVRDAAHRRLQAALSARIDAVERRKPGRTAADRERDMRALAAMVRMLDGLTAMDGALAAKAASTSDGEGGAADDVEALRRGVAARLRGMLEREGLLRLPERAEP